MLPSADGLTSSGLQVRIILLPGPWPLPFLGLPTSGNFPTRSKASERVSSLTQQEEKVMHTYDILVFFIVKALERRWCQHHFIQGILNDQLTAQPLPLGTL